MEAMLIIVAIIWVAPMALLALVAAPAMIVPRYRRYLAVHLVGDRRVSPHAPTVSASEAGSVALANPDEMERLAA